MSQDDAEMPLRLLGPTIAPHYYEDERALTEYVWKHYQQLMTPLKLIVVQSARASFARAVLINAPGVNTGGTVDRKQGFVYSEDWPVLLASQRSLGGCRAVLGFAFL